MNFMTLFAEAQDRGVRVGLIGAGEFGLSLISQAAHVRGLDIIASVDRDLDQACERISTLGLTVARAPSRSAARTAAASGHHVVTDDFDLLLELRPDIIVEATGHADAGARHALRAIAAGIGVVMVSKETECVAGPLLAHKARMAGVAYTMVEGDQPALLTSLISRARVLGLPIIAAGKSSEYDYVFDPDTGDVTWTDQTTTAPEIANLWDLGAGRRRVLAARSRALEDLPQRTVPDYCEMVLAINATGLQPDRPDFHAPLTRANELQDVYVPAEDGGILSGPGKIDVFNNLRRPDETSFAGGVFVVVSWPDPATGLVFRGKGIPTSRDGRYGVMYNPSHLLGVEAPLCILAAARLGNQYVGPDYRPRVDLIARAGEDLPAGTQLTEVGVRHAIPGLVPEIQPARGVAGEAPLPYFMAVGCTLRRPVAKGRSIVRDDVESPADSDLWSLRAEMDRVFVLT